MLVMDSLSAGPEQGPALDAPSSVIPKDFVRIPVRTVTQTNVGDFLVSPDSKDVGVVLEKVPTGNLADSHTIVLHGRLRGGATVPMGSIFSSVSLGIQASAPGSVPVDMEKLGWKVYRAPSAARWAEELYRNYGNPRFGDYAAVPGKKDVRLIDMPIAQGLMAVIGFGAIVFGGSLTKSEYWNTIIRLVGASAAGIGIYRLMEGSSLKREK